MWIDTKQDRRTINVVGASFDSEFTPEAQAMLAAVEAYLKEHTGVDEPPRKQPASERIVKEQFRGQSFR